MFDALDLSEQLLHHALHGENLGGAADHVVLLGGVLQDALRAEELRVVFTEEFNQFSELWDSIFKEKQKNDAKLEAEQKAKEEEQKANEEVNDKAVETKKN